MSANPIAGFGKKVSGYVKEFVAEITGDARLQEEGARDIVEGRTEGAGPVTDPRHKDAPKPPRR